MSFYTYVVNGCDYEFESKMFDRDDVAEECAEDYHDNHDGWESTWPITLELWNLNKTKMFGEFRIDIEAQPVFFAKKKV